MNRTKNSSLIIFTDNEAAFDIIFFWAGNACR